MSAQNKMGPNDAQIQKLLSLPQESPLAVLNLFKFKDRAEYQPGDPKYNTEASEISGRDACAIYGSSAGKLIKDLGGKIVFSTPVDQILIGSDDIDWDIAAIMYFSSRQAFLKMLTDEDFKKHSRHRKAALANHNMIHLNGSPFF